MHFRAAILALALAACASSRGAPLDAVPQELTGEWLACVTNLGGIAPKRVCGALTVWAAGPTPRGRGADFWLRHALELNATLSGEPRSLPAFGFINRTQQGAWRLVLGEENGVTEGSHSTALHGSLSREGDSLIGAWSRTCYDTCSDSGVVVLRRGLR